MFVYKDVLCFVMRDSDSVEGVERDREEKTCKMNLSADRHDETANKIKR